MFLSIKKLKKIPVIVSFYICPTVVTCDVTSEHMAKNLIKGVSCLSGLLYFQVTRESRLSREFSFFLILFPVIEQER
jgi:hypothetical protein